MEVYKVYAIVSLKDKRIYVGLSSDPERRLKEHNSGQVFSTKGFTPWKLFYVEEIGKDLKMARQREKALKTTSGKRFLRKLLYKVI